MLMSVVAYNELKQKELVARCARYRANDLYRLWVVGAKKGYDDRDLYATWVISERVACEEEAAVSDFYLWYAVPVAGASARGLR